MLGEDQLGQDHRGHHVGLEVPVEQLDRGVEELVHVAGADVAAVVDQYVDATPPLEDGGHRRAQRRAVEQVEVDGRARPPSASTSAAVESSDPGSGVVLEAATVDECSRSSPSWRVRAATATS